MISKLLYKTGNFIYFKALFLASFWNKKAQQWIQGRKNWKQKLTDFKKHNHQKVIWMHCASLGEWEQGRPLLEALKKDLPDYAFVVSFFSPSGYEVQQQNPLLDYVCYLPENRKTYAQFFIKSLNPELVLWIKYDFWNEFIEVVVDHKIPLLLISARFRKAQPFFAPYGSFWRKMLHSFTHIFVQEKESIHLLKTINTFNASIAGDTRFDRVIALEQEIYQNQIIEEFIQDKPCIIAGSTWSEDDEVLCHYSNVHTNIKYIIAPHHIYEDRLLEIEKLYKNTIRYSKWEQNTNAHVLIIDNIGMLSYIYRYATVCYIGGGFGADGVHNTLEAAVYGKPVIMGPEFEKYQEAIELIDNDAAYSIEDALELEQLLNEMFTDTQLYNEIKKAAFQYVHSNVGSTQKIVEYIYANRLLTKS